MESNGTNVHIYRAIKNQPSLANFLLSTRNATLSLSHLFPSFTYNTHVSYPHPQPQVIYSRSSRSHALNSLLFFFIPESSAVGFDVFGYSVLMCL